MSDLRDVMTQAIQERLTLWNAMRLHGDAPPPEGYADLSDAILSAINEAGYVIVPRDPTDHMIFEGINIGASRDKIVEIWQAMIGALDA